MKKKQQLEIIKNWATLITTVQKALLCIIIIIIIFSTTCSKDPKG